MADVVNLNRFRKAKARQDREVKAQENRVAFGRNKADKDIAKAREAQAKRRLDGHRLQDDDTP